MKNTPSGLYLTFLSPNCVVIVAKFGFERLIGVGVLISTHADHLIASKSDAGLAGLRFDEDSNLYHCTGRISKGNNVAERLCRVCVSP